MRDYELMVVINPELDDEGMSTIMDKLKGLITERGGSITDVEQWGRRRLAYPIKRFLEGNYVLTHFKMDPNLTNEVDAGLRLLEAVLRHLIVRL
ncbi:MAG: 30S ribosomal protein S6 [Dehalococcoidia bacterium]